MPNKVMGNSVFANHNKLTLQKADINQDNVPLKAKFNNNAHVLPKHKRSTDDEQKPVATKGPTLGSKQERAINSGDSQVVNSSL